MRARHPLMSPPRGMAITHQTRRSCGSVAFGDYTPGRFGWFLNGIRRVEPIDCKGALGLWTLSPTLVRKLEGL